MVLDAALLLIALQSKVDDPVPPQLASTASALVSVDVVVKDRKGRPVGTLGPGDFELFVDGNPTVASVFIPPLSMSLEETTQTRPGGQSTRRPPHTPFG